MKINENWLAVLLGLFVGALAIVTIKEIFDNDNSKIISNKGQSFLLNEGKMKQIDEKIKAIDESSNQHREILI